MSERVWYAYFHNNGDGTTRLFDTETCENCGAVCEAANAVGGVVADIPKYLRLGLKEWTGDWPLPEQGWNDDLEGCDCENCRE